jgi:predicted transcriptional regulator of viral defense system
MPNQPSRAAFTLDQARTIGLRKEQVYRMVTVGDLHRVGRGVYVRPDMVDPTLESLTAATVAQSAATMCLTSALVHHGLSDAIPFGTDIALPRGVRHPAGFEHVGWHSFDPTTFDLERTSFANLDGLHLNVYSPERTIIDSFRLAYREGSDVANIALRRWLTRRGNSPSSLLQLAEAFPRALPRLRQALEVLL